MTPNQIINALKGNLLAEFKKNEKLEKEVKRLKKEIKRLKK
jgi:cell division protein FtsB